MGKLDNKVILAVAVGIVVLLAGVGLLIANSKNLGTTESQNATTSQTTNSANITVYTPAQAVESAKSFYDYYVPLKAKTDIEVGDSTTVEPAAVQMLRAGKVGLDESMYKNILEKYMKEYQATGKVTSDLITCKKMPDATITAKLSNSSAKSAVVNVTLTYAEQTVTVPVTIDLTTSKLLKIDCSAI